MHNYCVLTDNPEKIREILPSKLQTEYKKPALYFLTTAFEAGKIRDRIKRAGLPTNIRRIARNPDIQKLPGLLHPVINRTELTAILNSLGGATICTIDAKTTPDLLKRGNPYAGRVCKISRVNGLLNWIYGAAVNRQREKEGQPLDEYGRVEHFQVAPRQWGQRLEKTPFVMYRDKLYVEVKVQKSLGHQYRDIETNDIIPDSLLEPFLPKRSEGKRQELENPIVLRDYSLESITGIQIRGRFYEVE